MIIKGVDIHEDWFWAFASKSDGCWVWQGGRDSKGYGKFKRGGLWFKAHRVALVLMGVCVPDGLFVCHKCDNPSCINPAHLFVGTPADNVRDMVSKGRKAIVSGREGVANPNAKLSATDVFAILKDDRNTREIAASYGIHRRYVNSIKRREPWSCLRREAL